MRGFLERQTGAELERARAAGTSDPAEVHVGDGLLRIVVILPIHRVEKVGANLQAIARPEREAFREGHMAAHAGRAARHIQHVRAWAKRRVGH